MVCARQDGEEFTPPEALMGSDRRIELASEEILKKHAPVR
jgi:hypothetical protein